MNGLEPARPGFDGKLPSRGDFVAHGLPRRFLVPWRDWADRVLAASQAELGADWLPLWLVAPVWRFSCAPGVAGPAALAGLLLPSVDRVGRYYPLTVAALFPTLTGPPAPPACDSWLDRIEPLAIAAVTEAHAPEALADALARNDVVTPAPGTTDGPASVWWRAPLPPPADRLVFAGLPDPATFTAMIGGRDRPPFRQQIPPFSSPVATEPGGPHDRA